MVEPTPPVKDSTILNQTPPPVPTSEQRLYDKSQDAPVPPPETPPSGTPPATPPATHPPTPAPPAAPIEPTKPQEPPKPGTPPTPPEVPATPVALDLKLPDGSPLSADDVAATLKDATEKKMTQEQAQGLLQAKDQTARTVIARQNDAFESTKKAWKDSVSKDPEIGGENYARNIEIASRAWDKLATPELKKIAEQSGIGNHPEVIRLMLRVGNLISEDRLVLGSVGTVPTKRSKEDILYGNPKAPSAPLA